MRVTERSIFESGKAQAASARERHASAVERASTGIALQHPWDAPGAARVALEKITATQAGAIATVAERTNDELNAADGALATVVESLTSAVELAIQLVNSTYSADDRARAAGQVRAQMKGAIAALNVQVGGRFIMGGTQDQRPPFASDTGAYLGDDGVRRIEAGPGAMTDASVRADIVIGGASAGAGAPAGIDVLAAMERFAQALEADDVAAIRTSIDELQASIGQVALGRSAVGAMELTAEATTLASRAVEASALERKASFTDVDFIDAATDLALAERSLEATLAVSAKSFQLSLLDRL